MKTPIRKGGTFTWYDLFDIIGGCLISTVLLGPFAAILVCKLLGIEV